MSADDAGDGLINEPRLLFLDEPLPAWTCRAISSSAKSYVISARKG